MKYVATYVYYNDWELLCAIFFYNNRKCSKSHDDANFAESKLGKVLTKLQVKSALQFYSFTNSFLLFNYHRVLTKEQATLITVELQMSLLTKNY